MKCEDCWGEVGSNFPDVVYNEWLKLMHYFELEYTEGEVTEETYETMMNSLMALKPYIPCRELEVKKP